MTKKDNSIWGSTWERESFWAGVHKPRWKQYVFNVGLAISQFLNVWLGGHPDESISSRLGRAQLDPNASKTAKKAAWAVDKLFGPEHCLRACEVRVYRNQEVFSWSSKTDYPPPPKYHPQFPKDDPRNDLLEFLSEQELEALLATEDGLE